MPYGPTALLPNILALRALRALLQVYWPYGPTGLIIVILLAYGPYGPYYQFRTCFLKQEAGWKPAVCRPYGSAVCRLYTPRRLEPRGPFRPWSGAARSRPERASGLKTARRVRVAGVRPAFGRPRYRIFGNSRPVRRTGQRPVLLMIG